MTAPVLAPPPAAAGGSARRRRGPASAPPARPLHPAAWWLWALGLAVAASRTTNPIVLGLVVAVAGYVVVARRSDAPHASAYGVFLRLGLVVVAVRTGFHVVLGGVVGPTELFALPEVPLPDWAAGIRLGGPVTAEGLVSALYDGLRLATLLICVGAANALADPKRLLRSLPAAMYEVSVAVVVALTTAPQLVAGARQVRRVRALRGDTARGWRALRSVLVPVVEDALERSLTLAAAMDSRGYGRTVAVPARTRRLTAALVLGGLLALGIGAYGLLDPRSPALLGAPAMGLGVLAGAAGLALGARRSGRTRYRPDRWGRRELGVAGSGVVAAAGLVVAEATGTAALAPPVVPLEWPQLPATAAVCVLVALLPAWVAPDPRAGGRRGRGGA